MIPSSKDSQDFFPAGLPVRIGRHGYCHYAIVSDRSLGGKPMLISLSYRTGTVAEEAWDEAVRGREVTPSGFRSELDPEEIVGRARSHLGQRSYHLITNNCEHFVCDALGLPPRSRQLEAAAGAGVGALLFALRLARGHPLIAIAAGAAGMLLGSRLSAR